MRKILIVGTVPYNKKSTSRAFESYFSDWERENLAQIFSNTKTPCKGHCGTLFQITDKRMLKRRFDKKVETGKIFLYDDLPEEWTDTSLEVGGTFSKLYKLGRKHTPLTHLIRKFIWEKKYWQTKALDEWLEEFKPDCVFLSFSDDFFIPQIALYVAEKFDIPIVSSIGDDYYFNGHFSLSPFYHIYKSSYRKLIRKVFAHKGSAIYISDKIRDKYNKEFSLNGETVYLTSTVKRKPFTVVKKENPVITYFGNIRMGRNRSLNDIATALGELDSAYVLQIYSNETDEKYFNIFKGNPNAVFGGSIPYADVQKKIAESDITIVVEGFEKKDIDQSRYSLSTKAADALASGAAIFAYGSQECGVIEYLQSTEAAVVCTDKSKLTEDIGKLFVNEEEQLKRYQKAQEMTEQHHNLKSSCAVVFQVIENAITNYKGRDNEQ
ncbi:MAG: glycosyltransferase [Clostridia bacterium]|nr:glycosyltransferase [Clostridia bacterium]